MRIPWRFESGAPLLDRIDLQSTIADLSGSPAVAATHVAEALQYRSLSRNYWI